MDVDGAGTGGAGTAARQERAAGFVSVREKSRTPFMPTPRRRHARPIVPVSAPMWTKRTDDAAAKSVAQPLSDSPRTNDAERSSLLQPAQSPVRTAATPSPTPATPAPRTPSLHTPSLARTHPHGPRVRTRAPSPEKRNVEMGPPAYPTPCAQTPAPRTITRPTTSLASSRPIPKRPATSMAAVIMDDNLPYSPEPCTLQENTLARGVRVKTQSAALPAHTVRAKITEGIIPTPKSRTQVESSERPSRNGQRMPLPSQPLHIPRPPSPNSRMDILALQHEMDDNSFVLAAEDAQCADAVQVHVRVRPTRGDEACAWIATGDTATLSLDPAITETRMQPHVGGPYYFDNVHTGSSNARIYATLARPLVHSALHGYNAVVFAYGQTASGKTFTLSGDDAGLEPGVIPRAVNDLFQGICQGSTQREYLIRVSYLEIWNEIVRDLLEPSNQPTVRDDRRRGANAVLVAPLHEEVVTSPAHVFRLLARGEANRHTGATDWNERSSRSHTCFKITIESWDRAPGAVRPYRISELSLIDLAGSERHSTHTTQRRAEGGNINKSLLSLGKVIFALSEKATRGASVHVPYRDSKLTRILQNNLNGGARIAVVCTLNPSPAMVDESLSTLNFARRIKHVPVRASVNEFEGDMSALDESHALLARYREEMGALRAHVADLETKKAARRSPGHAGETPLTVDALRARLDELGTLILQGGEKPSERDTSHPISPTKQRGFAFDDPLPVVQEKLHAALQKIQRLERQLAARMSLPTNVRADADAKDARIEHLLQQVRELEIVCEAQKLDAPQVTREEVELEWMERLEAAEAKTRERDAFLAEMSAECARLRRANEALVRLAHQQTSSMVTQLATCDDTQAPAPVLSVFAPRLRPATVLGTRPMRTNADISIDSASSGRLTSSDVDDLLEDV